MPGTPQMAPQKASDSTTTTGSTLRLTPCMRGAMKLPTAKWIDWEPTSSASGCQCAPNCTRAKIGGSRTAIAPPMIGT